MPWTDAPAATVQAQGDCDPLPSESIEKLILKAAQKEGVNPKLVRAMVKRESGGKACAVSAKGAQGLMQLMPATQAGLGVGDPFDAESNVNGGVKYLKQMLDRYEGNSALALAAYNAGPQRVTPGGKIPDIPETQAYVMGILAELNEENAPAVK
jgi:soluble lytic murein transglycosylase-like protein